MEKTTVKADCIIKRERNDLQRVLDTECDPVLIVNEDSLLNCNRSFLELFGMDNLDDMVLSGFDTGNITVKGQNDKTMPFGKAWVECLNNKNMGCCELVSFDYAKENGRLSGKSFRLWQCRLNSSDEILYRFEDVTGHEVINPQDCLLCMENRLKVRKEYAGMPGEAGAWVWDVCKGVVEWEPVTYRIFGVKSNLFELTTKNFMDMVFEDDRDHVRISLLRAFESSGCFDFVFRVKTEEEGVFKVVHCFGHAVTNDKGLPTHLKGVHKDVTSIV